MKLPNADRAVIPAAKLRDYLLNEDHPENRGKARLLRALGYGREDWGRLEEDLRQQHLVRDATLGNPGLYGASYRITAAITGPRGTATMVSIWIITWEADLPSFVTMYPED